MEMQTIQELFIRGIASGILVFITIFSSGYLVGKVIAFFNAITNIK
jgi:flagellar biosynthesis protein FliQ